ncbi:hypothetical protein [Ectopseudomonas alcaliphila]|uniref:Uncharacterized protein n=1 Tax=Ectopseudomonas alcaliphila TaxID=101564 RepID=A0ABU4Q0X6_9GAMM|nr:hypothetical protein [Pseudomonas alcaliphila]MDX5991741.1 hypothetical protein [Pseudomonas alcaliphila]
MADSEELLVFPDIVPDSIVRTRLWVHENSDFKDEEAISDLLGRLYDYPEDDFCLYVLREESVAPLLGAAIDNGVVSISEAKGHYYPHPKFKRDYICIKESLIRWEWEREVLLKGNMYFQHALKLTVKARREFEMQQQVAMHKAADSNPLMLQPNFMGLGVDLNKAYSWLSRKMKK